MKLRALSLLAISLFVTSAAFGVSRTWVSGVGDDVNPCSRTAPCKTFAGAIIKTSPGGQISVLDPGGYGAVTITKSVTIDGAGTLGSNLHSLVNGVIINAGVNDQVILRNIQLDGIGNGTNSIRVINNGAKTIILENVGLLNATTGISAINNANTVTIYLSNVDIHNMTTNGISLAPTGTGFVFGIFDGVRIGRVGTTTSHDGIVQGASTNTHLKNVTVFNAAGNGLNLNGAGALSTIENSTFLRNGANGVRANASLSVIRVGRSAAVQNFGAGFSENLGTIFSYQDNQSSDNGLVDSASTPQPVY